MQLISGCCMVAQGFFHEKLFIFLLCSAAFGFVGKMIVYALDLASRAHMPDQPFRNVRGYSNAGHIAAIGMPQRMNTEISKAYGLSQFRDVVAPSL